MSGLAASDLTVSNVNGQGVSSVGRVQGVETGRKQGGGGGLADSNSELNAIFFNYTVPVMVIAREYMSPSVQVCFFSRTGYSHCDRIYSSFTAERCIDDGYEEQQSVAWKDYCAVYW